MQPLVDYNDQCCYCECKLDDKIRTREHVIPKHQNGRVLRSCCLFCNREKGGRNLQGYKDWLTTKFYKEKNDKQRAQIAVKIKNILALIAEIRIMKFHKAIK
jgi:hypothetical protein